jgi:NAD-dependent dihydropyrimidine dehydrogenase PreA subunit
MIRKIIQIDEEKCNGCGLCCDACHEGAIGLVDGKAKLLRDDYCDGLGNCLPVCPTGAISFVEREAAAYDEAAVKENAAKKQDTAQKNAATQKTPADKPQDAPKPTLPCGCPGTHAKALARKPEPNCDCTAETQTPSAPYQPQSRLNQWPVQIKLVSVNAPYLNGAHLLIAADCTAYAYGDFHNRFIKNKITLIGCPKLDEGDYAEKLTAILKNNDIKSVTVVRMEVPCCGGIVNSVKTALINSGKMLPWQVVTISTDGQILED